MLSASCVQTFEWATERFPHKGVITELYDWRLNGVIVGSKTARRLRRAVHYECVRATTWIVNTDVRTILEWEHFH